MKSLKEEIISAIATCEDLMREALKQTNARKQLQYSEAPDHPHLERLRHCRNSLIEAFEKLLDPPPAVEKKS